jgi:hypothetical protein
MRTIKPKSFCRWIPWEICLCCWSSMYRTVISIMSAFSNLLWFWNKHKFMLFNFYKVLLKEKKTQHQQILMIWSHKTSLSQLFLCIWRPRLSYLSVSTIFLMGFTIVLMVWYMYIFSLSFYSMIFVRCYFTFRNCLEIQFYFSWTWINIRVTCHFLCVLIGLKSWGYFHMYGIWN